MCAPPPAGNVEAVLALQRQCRRHFVLTVLAALT
jgi:hypothetical protein